MGYRRGRYGTARKGVSRGTRADGYLPRKSGEWGRLEADPPRRAATFEEGLFDVAFEDEEQFAEAALAFGGVRGTGDAAFGVLLDEDFGEGLEGLAHGDDLGEDFGAVGVVVDHGFDGADLASDFAEALAERLHLFRTVMMMGVGVRVVGIVGHSV